MWQNMITCPQDEPVLVSTRKLISPAVAMFDSRHGVWLIETLTDWSKIDPPYMWQPCPDHPK